MERSQLFININKSHKNNRNIHKTYKPIQTHHNRNDPIEIRTSSAYRPHGHTRNESPHLINILNKRTASEPRGTGLRGWEPEGRATPSAPPKPFFVLHVLLQKRMCMAKICAPEEEWGGRRPGTPEHTRRGCFAKGGFPGGGKTPPARPVPPGTGHDVGLKRSVFSPGEYFCFSTALVPSLSSSLCIIYRRIWSGKIFFWKKIVRLRCPCVCFAICELRFIFLRKRSVGRSFGCFSNALNRKTVESYVKVFIWKKI